MMFTEQDHAKAVELYQRYRHAEWWPANTHWNDQDGAWQCNLDGKPYWSGNELEKDHALSAIAWAMVLELARCGECGWMQPASGHQGRKEWSWTECTHTGSFIAATPFLALAAAMEAQ